MTGTPHTASRSQSFDVAATGADAVPEIFTESGTKLPERFMHTEAR
jgi:hypothetical protein